MKKIIFLTGSLLTITLSFGQTVYLPNTAGNVGTTNVHIGAYSGSDSSNLGYSNVFIGFNAGLENETGYGNVFNGYNAGYNNTTGLRNVFIGQYAGENNTTGKWNVAIGSYAGNLNNSDGGVFLGTNAGRNNTGAANTLTGLNSGMLNTSGNNNSFYGYYSGYNSTGLNNVILGSLAGYNAGSGNVFLGYSAGRYELQDNKLYIANSDTPNPLIYGEFDNKNLKFNANKVGIGPEFGNFPTLTFDNGDNYRLFVRGGILAEEVRVRLQADWADYVFNDDYKLLSLKETEEFVIQNGHLPNMPSAQQVKEEGLEIGNIVKLQQEKIEELTLHLIKQDKQIQLLKQQNKKLEELNEKVEFLLKKQ